MTEEPPAALDWDAPIPATWSLVVAIAAVYLATGVQQVASGEAGWVEALLGPRGARFRADVGGQARDLVAAGETWRLWTSVLLHGDGLHLILNATGLLVLGRLLEPMVGSTRLLAWFAAGGLAGAALSQLVGVRQSDGASGGAFALMGAALALGWRLRRELPPQDARLLGPVLGGFAALNVALSFALPFVNAAGHLGGLVLGLLWGGAAVLGRRARPLDLAVIGLFVVGCAYGWWRCFA